MTSMMDIVFIMLIFFVVTASFVREFGIETNQPENSKTTDVEPRDIPILFKVESDNDIRFDGRYVELENVRALIKQAHVAGPDLPVIIQPKDGAYTGRVIALYDAAIAVGMPADKVNIIRAR